MANYERGSTEHDDDVPVFDGGEDDDDTDGSHLPVVIVISILVLAAFGGVVWLAYNQGVARGRSDVPARVAMQETGGENQASGSQIKVYQQPATADEDFSQTAAAKSSQAVQAQPTAAKADTKAVTQPAESKPAGTHMAAATQTTPPAALAPAKPKPVPEVSSVATAPPAQLSLSNSKPATKPVEKPTPVAAKPAATLAKPAAAAPAAGGAYVLQIGAYKSQDEAMAAWKAYQAKHSALLSGLGPDVQKADLGAKGTWYRLRVGSFAEKPAAVALCDRLKADNGACFLAR